MGGFSRDQVRDEGFTALHSPERPEVDIVFVHGLGGHPYDTWAHQSTEPTPSVERPSLQISPPVPDPGPLPAGDGRKRTRFRDRLRRRFGRGSTTDNGNRIDGGSSSRDPPPVPQNTCNLQDQVNGIYWIKDLLAAEAGFEKARILVYGYDSKVTKGYANVNHNNLFAHAKNLMYALARDKPPRRPVIFVAHSLGGLLVKEVLRRSEASEEDEIKDIVRCTKSVIFLGTPHRGSPGMASLGESVRATASIILRLDTNNVILRSLGTDSPELELGRESFVTLWRKYDLRVRTFQEAWGISGVNIGPLNKKVVPDVSSTLDDPREHPQTISANHMNMCIFRHRLDNDYQKLTSEIRMAVLAAMEDPKLNDEGREFMRSLAYDDMYNRRETIKRALDSTCQWLYITEEYSTWIERQDLSENLGLLWIKGKPGSGKSTLMKDALFHAKRQLSGAQITTAGFFFNARGTQRLEKKPLGLYRSLLHEVLQQDMLAVHHLAPTYKKKKELYFDGQWTEQELQDMFCRVFATSESRAAVLFIDAMDECNDDEVRDLVRFFKTLAKKAFSAGARLSICFSSRHYPHISIQCPELVVEAYNGADIMRYIEMEAEDNRPIAHLKHEIFDKSSGVFLWVVLVIAMLQKHGRGKSTKLLRQKLRKIPPTLDALFRKLFSQNEPDDEARVRSQTICLMQVVLFAAEPMTLSQIHTAIAFGTNTHDSLQNWKDSVEYLDVVAQKKELVLDLSKGLLEETYAHYRRDEEPRYQIIHETVREFFLSGEGFRLLGFSSDNVARGSHLMVAQCCINYLATIECESIATGAFSEWKALGPDFVLLDYISIHIFDHIEAAIQHGAPGDTVRTLIYRLRNGDCRLLNFLSSLRVATPFQAESSIIMAAIQFNAPRSLRLILDMGFDVNEPSPTLAKYALHAVLFNRRWAMTTGLTMIDLLLSANADVDLKNSLGQTPLHRAAMTTTRVVAKLLAKNPRVNERDNDGQTPFDRAQLSMESEGIRKLLVQHGARPKPAWRYS